jgi:hypothetical protein
MTKTATKLHDKAIRAVIALLVLAASCSLVMELREQKLDQIQTRAALHNDMLFAYIFRLRYVCEPELDGYHFVGDFPGPPNTYKRMVFMMAPPPESERVYGVIYAYPDSTDTVLVVANLNLIISERPSILDDSGLEYPVTTRDVLEQHSLFLSKIMDFDMREKSILSFGESSSLY